MVRNTGGVIESVEPARERPEAEMSARMARLRRRDTTPELALRKELHHRGLSLDPLAVWLLRAGRESRMLL